MVLTAQVCSSLQLSLEGLVIYYDLKHCRCWNLGSQTALSTASAQEALQEMTGPRCWITQCPPLLSTAGIQDLNLEVATGRVLMHLTWKTQDLIVGKFSQNFRDIFCKHLGRVQRVSGGLLWPDVMILVERLPHILMKALEPQYFPVSYLIASPADEQASPKGNTLHPHLPRQTKQIRWFRFCKRQQQLKVPIDV